MSRWGMNCPGADANPTESDSEIEMTSVVVVVVVAAVVAADVVAAAVVVAVAQKC